MQDGDDLKVMLLTMGDVLLAFREVLEHCYCEVRVLFKLSAQLFVSSQQGLGRAEEFLEEARH